MKDDVTYLMRGVMPVNTPSSVLVSSSKYLNNARLREWVAMIMLRRNGPDYPPPAEMGEFLAILNELRDFARIEELFTDERKTNPALDAWFKAGHVSDYKIEDLEKYAPGTVGRIYYDITTKGNYQVQIVPWMKPQSQLEFFNLRSGQTHDYEHILCGGGFNYMGELVPYWYRLTNVHKHIQNKELAGELSVLSIFGTMRYIVRTMLHYPEVWETAVGCIQRGITVGQQSDALFMAKIEDVWHLPLEEARRVLGVRGAVDVDTWREGEFWAERLSAAELQT
ncbi:MAG: hypothetical protein K2P94_15695 [Rhodospirillaceae bacterium]|nr:hypothetical protein [Rhodospirillaceae bacterium]